MALFPATRRSLSSLLSRTLSPLRCLLHIQTSPPPQHHITPITIPTRFKSTGSYNPLNNSSTNFSNRPPKNTILLDGCDYEHWLIIMEFDQELSEDDMVRAYVNRLTAVLGSEEEAKEKIYSVCTTTYTGFGALISEELSNKVKNLPGVLWVLPDSYLDVPNKDYGGDLFIDGKVIHRPQYRFDQRPQPRNRTRPRYDRRRETMEVERTGPMQREYRAQEHIDPTPQQSQMGIEDPLRRG